jgi:hypothetical protein
LNTRFKLPDRASVCSRVEVAFAERPYPGDDRIAKSDSRYESYEGHAVTAFHRGKTWKEITLRHLVDDYAGDASACLAFMTPEGWRYYLPAYLLIALQPDEADAIGDAVVGNVTHPRARTALFARVAIDLGLEPEVVLAQHTERFVDRISGLTNEELEAVRTVLQWLAAWKDAGNARFDVAMPNLARAALDSWSYLGSS